MNRGACMTAMGAGVAAGLALPHLFHDPIGRSESGLRENAARKYRFLHNLAASSVRSYPGATGYVGYVESFVTPLAAPTSTP